MKTITTPEERKPLIDGKIHHLIDEKNLSHVRLFSHVYLKPGEEIKIHEHIGEYEVYYLISGKGIYTENGKENIIEKGNVTYCKNGSSHGLKNIGEDVLEFIALIVVE